MKLLVMLLMFLSLASCYSEAKEYGLNGVIKKKSGSYLLSYSEFKQLSDANKNSYIKIISYNLLQIDKNLKQERDQSYNDLMSIILSFFIEEAYASNLQCIGGGVFVKTGASSCGMNSYAGFTCPAGKEICNPLIFGVSSSGQPVCHQTATTNWCYKNTKPGYTTRLDLVFQKQEARDAWNDFSRDVDEVCREAKRSRIQEEDYLVDQACSNILDQTRRNQERINSGRIKAEYPINSASSIEANSGICIDCLSNAPVIRSDISELASSLPQEGGDVAIEGVNSPIENPEGWDINPYDRILGRCVTQKNALSDMPRPEFPVITDQLVREIENKLNNAGVSDVAFQKALSFYQNNKDVIKNSRYITILDMSQSARNKRKFLIDLETGEVESYFVAHGRGSDPSQAGRVQSFGGNEGTTTNKTPEGFHLTGQIYNNGKYPPSLVLHGQEKGVNDASCRRSIVVHRALGNGGVAGRSTSNGNGTLWRSNGCFAMNKDETRSFVERTENGSVYYVHRGN